MIAAASSLLWKFKTPLRQNATHLFVLLADGAYIDIFWQFELSRDTDISEILPI